MKYLLDTNAVIAALRGHPQVLARLHQQHRDDIRLSTLVVHELAYGAYRSEHPERNLSILDALQIDALPFDQEDARRAGMVRAALSQSGQMIGPYDVLIAGQALEKRLTLVTHNVREFQRVHGLSVEDWE